jgi:nucleotide-binding universal stress UspA family protein
LRARRPTAPPPRLDVAPAPARPVLLATFDVPFDADAAELGVDAAAEAGAALHVVNVVAVQFMPITLVGWDYVERPDVEESLRRPTELATSLGVRVERLRVRSPHPVAALLQVSSERDVGLIVFGPDRSCLSRWRYRRAAKAIRERATTLVWTAD